MTYSRFCLKYNHNLTITKSKNAYSTHCVISVQIRSFFWSVFSRNTGKYGPERTPYLETFHVVYKLWKKWKWVAVLKSSVIRQKGESQSGCLKKTKHAKFSKKRTFFTPWYVHAGCFLEIPVLRFALLPFYRRFVNDSF